MKSLYSLLFLFTLGLTSAAQAPNYIPTEGLVGWWPLNGSAMDDGSFENHGTVSGAVATTNRYNEVSGAMAFDGIDDHIVIPDAPSLQITENLTISLWYMTPGPSGNYQTFLTKRSGGQWPYSFGLSHYYGSGGCPGELDKYITGRRNGSSQYDLRVTEKTYVSNQWTHAAMTIENDVVTFYENGLPIGSTCFGDEFFVSPIDQGAPLTFGTCNCGSTEMMTGSLDDIGIWNRSLSPEEIATLFQSQENPSIEGCTDDEACNFDEASTLEDGSCEYGCNHCGPGTTWDAELQLCLPEIECDSLYNPDVDFDGFIGLTDLLTILSHYNNEWPPWECGDPLEYQGYDYATVQIGDQCWFAENLRAENYRNGDAIMQVNEASTWQSLSEGGRRIYGLGDMNCGVEGDTIGLCSQSSAEVLNFGGYLYNWYVVAEGSNVCPNGWHAPDNDAFDELLEHAENLSAGLSGLKSTEGWVEGSEGSNQTGFRAIGSGYGGNLGNFASDGHFTGFWSANASSGTNAHHLQIDERPNSAPTGGVFINGNNKKYALSIRCIKDTEQ